MRYREFGMLWAIVLLCGLPARASEPLVDALAATFRIACKDTSGTCFLVATGNASDANKRSVVLVTAAHFFEQAPDAQCELMLRSQKADESYSRQVHSLSIRNGGKPRWKKHPSADVAALPVELPEGIAVTPFDLDQLASAAGVAEGKLRVGQEIFVPCYPAKLEANEAGWPVLRKGSIASYPLAPVKFSQRILIDCTTFGGDSGAPVVVVSQDKAHVVGIVLGMHRQTDKSSLPFEERTVHTPLGLAIVSQSALIRETISLLGDGP